MEETKVKSEHKRLSVGSVIKRALFILIGGILMGAGLEIFLVPNGIMDGGIVGVSIILSYVTAIQIGIFLFVLNLPFLFLGYKILGKTFSISTLFGITVLSVTTTFLHHVPAFTEDLLLATVFGGITIGAGIGLVIRYGGALDGTEILAILFNRKMIFSVGEIIMFMNFFIFTIGGFVLGWNNAMYSVLAYFIAFKTIDIVIDGLDESKSATIISDQHKEIGEAIIDRLGRGVTYFHGEGAYTGENKKIVYCIVTRLEEAKLKSIVDEIDPGAFLAVADVDEVRGGRFKKRNIH
ncbi:YitT family protein [Thalassobacillus pellis]|uniref:YitT family protein n=1 Tax=Thalassobacillus pellis TaxID=748008 RepID=UPI001961E311|nr:YitT family protein [Thalassobacillus pellis]MBM7553371.1 uncharacterized membrane-anchored protein YitT (DUF2179 family) [Thalassobacillus pellis]